MESVSSELKECRARKVLIAVDLETHSEQILSYSLLAAKDLLCEFTIFHCLKIGDSPQKAQATIKTLLGNAQTQQGKSPHHTFLIHIVEGNLLEQLQELCSQKRFHSLFIGTTNQLNSWIMGSKAKDILMNIDANIIMVPPLADLSFPNNIGILVEKKGEDCLDLFRTISLYTSNYNTFINFVLFSENQQAFTEDRKVIEEYQDLFESNITFSFIVEQEPTYHNFLKYVSDIHCDSAALAWGHDSSMYESAINHETGAVFCSPKMVIFYTKLKVPSYQEENIQTAFVE